MSSIGEKLARHLRMNRGVRIELYGSIVPPGWVPHYRMAGKMHERVMDGAWREAYLRWKKELMVGCVRERKCS